jgi:hypothetical protein
MRRSFVLAALCAAAFHAPQVRAQPSDRAVAAEALFAEGRSLIAQNRFAEACEKFDASRKLDPAVGTLLSLGHCYEAQQRTASAWFAYRAAVALAAQRNDLRRSTAEERASALEPQLPTIVVHLGEDPSGPPTQVAIDGEAFGPDALRAPIAVDPGPHSIEATASGRQPWSTRVEVQGPGKSLTVEIPVLEAISDPTIAEGARHARATRRVAGVALAAGGVIAIGVGSVLGVEAIEKGRDANRACPGGGTCSNAAAVSENNTAKSMADGSSVTIPIGAAVLALGATLFLTAREPRGPRIEATASAHGGQLGASWTW